MALTKSILLQTLLGPFRVYAEGTITRALEEGQWWDDHLKPIIDEADPSGWAIDIGAHIGWFTVYLAQCHPRVIAVEPYPESFRLLLENLRCRPEVEYRVQCWPVAAWDNFASLRLDPRNDHSDAGSFGFTETIGAGDVVGMPLDAYLQDSPISLIKCDARADLKALQGLELTIRRCRPLIVFEWEEGMAGGQGDRWDDYLRFFEGLNYQIERITPDYWDYVGRPQ